MATTPRGKAIRDRDIELRDTLFEDADIRLWDRSRFSGFATVPKTMPYVCRILDELSKGQPLSSTYLALWCWTWDNAFVKLGRMSDLAFAAGFSGQRGVRTFQDRLKRLVELGFVEVAPSGLQPLGLAFLPNPHIQIMRLYEAKMSPGGDAELRAKAAGIQASTYNALIERAQEIDCGDIKAELRRQQKVAKRVRSAADDDDDEDMPRARALRRPTPAGRKPRRRLKAPPNK